MSQRYENDNPLAAAFRRERPEAFGPGTDPRVALRQTEFEPRGASSQIGRLDERTSEQMRSDLEQESDDYREASRQGSGLDPSLFRDLTGQPLQIEDDDG